MNGTMYHLFVTKQQWLSQIRLALPVCMLSWQLLYRMTLSEDTLFFRRGY